jgi:hypothetical protein
MTYRQKVRKIYPTAKIRMIYEGPVSFSHQVYIPCAGYGTEIYRSYRQFFQRTEQIWKDCYEYITRKEKKYGLSNRQEQARS